MKVRVLHVVGALNVGGAETWLTQGLPHIDLQRYQFDFLVYGEGAQHYQRKVEQAGGRVLRVPAPRSPVRFLSGFLALLRRERYHVVHAHTYCSCGWVLAVAAWAGVATRVFHSHTAQDESRRRSWRALYFRLSRWLIQHYATAAIAVSEEAASSFFPPDWRNNPKRWRISAVGIDVAGFMTPVDRSLVRKELEIPERAMVVIHVGRFVPVKNHGFLLGVAERVAQRTPDVYFVLVGDGPERAEMQAHARLLVIEDRVRFTGVRSDVARLLAASDVFVLPSLYEGMPLAYLEAQAAGLPCVISDTIAPAADLVPGRTTRLALARGPEIWAAAVLDSAALGKSADVPSRMKEVSIEGSMTRMLEAYQ